MMRVVMIMVLVVSLDDGDGSANKVGEGKDIWWWCGDSSDEGM